MKILDQTGVVRLNALLRRLFAVQAREVLSKVSLDSDAPDMSKWIETIAEAAKPILLQSQQAGMLRAARRMAARSRNIPLATNALLDTRFATMPTGYVLSKSGLRAVIKSSPTLNVSFDLFNPRVFDAVDEAAYKFCRETMATATSQLDDALARLRKLMKEGLERGDATYELARSVKTIFSSPARAFRIATTESSRAIHSGQLMAAREAGVKKKTWLASGDACEACLKLDGKTVPLDKPFYVDPRGGPYATIMAPPLHPGCFCDLTEAF